MKNTLQNTDQIISGGLCVGYSTSLKTAINEYSARPAAINDKLSVKSSFILEVYHVLLKSN